MADSNNKRFLGSTLFKILLGICIILFVINMVIIIYVVETAKETATTQQLKLKEEQLEKAVINLRLSEQQNSYFFLINKTASEMQKIKNEYNRARDFDESLGYGRDYAIKYLQMHSYLSDYHQFIVEHENELIKTGLNTFNEKKNLRDVMIGYQVQLLSMKKELADNAVRQQHDKDKYKELDELLAKAITNKID